MAKKDLSPPPVTGEVTLPNGCTLYWKVDEATGCREYMSDEVGGGVQVWHTALVDHSTLIAAVTQELTFQKLEYVIHQREQQRLRALNKDEIELFEKFLAEKAKADQEVYARVYGGLNNEQSANSSTAQSEDL